ncbi:MAG: hypothetical protein ORN49_11130, partial [Rhodobacteraceae bacterium]|nr:hypothetical protein [Paracoccaceae bacterium]
SADLSTSGGWIKPGIAITAVNDKPIERGATVAGMVLNNLHVDPDGYARVAVKYTDTSGAEQTALLAVQTVRKVNLANGINLICENIEGSWKTVVQSIAPESITTLRVGDTMFRDKTTGLLIDGPQTLEEALASLVSTKTATTDFSVIRDSKVTVATMQLATDGTASTGE